MGFQLQDSLGRETLWRHRGVGGRQGLGVGTGGQTKGRGPGGQGALCATPHWWGLPVVVCPSKPTERAPRVSPLCLLPTTPGPRLFLLPHPMINLWAFPGHNQMS